QEGRCDQRRRNFESHTPTPVFGALSRKEHCRDNALMQRQVLRWPGARTTMPQTRHQSGAPVMSALAASAVIEDDIQVIPQDAVIGAEIGGVDLSKPLAARTFARIEAAYDRHTVLVFRDQKLTPEQHIGF